MDKTAYTPRRIAAITMARNDDFFLNRWVRYYGEALGYEHLYIYLDGLEQAIPTRAIPEQVIQIVCLFSRVQYFCCKFVGEQNSRIG